MSLEISRREKNTDLSFDQSLHPVLKRIYSSRNIQSTDELDYSLSRLIPWQSLHGIDAAIGLLMRVIEEEKHILIIADFDTDGATSCALAIRGLQASGAKHLSYLVPNRFEFGYGLSPEIVELAAASSPDLIITVDNGISSIEGVRLARSKNIDVLITDHHLPGSQLPEATAIINPNQADDRFPSKYLAGVGVVFYLLMALRASLREQDWFEEHGIREPNLAELLDLVALGTIADLVPLDYNNRILVSQGVARIRAGRCCPGIKALFKAARRTLATLTSQDLGFIIAPRLNAAGRLTDMSLGIECLLTDDMQVATEYARRLEQLNQERKKIQQEMQTQALDTLNLQDISNNALPSGYCMFDESWHQGVIGIIASRIKDEIHRPVIAFAREDEKFLKGSARSIAGIHIRDVLDTVAARHPGMIVKFGGHAMAAGLTIPDSMLDDFRSAFHRILNEMYSMDDLKKCTMTDGELNDGELSMEVARILIEAGPWGQGFPEPLFDGEFKLVESRIVGDKHLKLQLNHGDKIIDAIAFNRTDDNWPHETQRLHTVYRLDINEFAGRRRLQLIIEELHPLP